MLSVFSSIFFAADAEAAAKAPIHAPVHGSPINAVFSPVETMQDSVAAWSCRGVYHVVGRGETIYSIARRYGTTAYRIAVCNGLASYTVYVGQTLLVPTARS
jgi:LysM repeat protein